MQLPPFCPSCGPTCSDCVCVFSVLSAATARSHHSLGCHTSHWCGKRQKYDSKPGMPGFRLRCERGKRSGRAPWRRETRARRCVRARPLGRRKLRARRTGGAWTRTTSTGGSDVSRPVGSTSVHRLGSMSRHGHRVWRLGLACALCEGFQQQRRRLSEREGERKAKSGHKQA